MAGKSEQIAESILAKIMSGELTGRLPAEQELARQCGVSPVTAAKALNILRDKGVVRRVTGRGTFVTGNGRTVVRIAFNRYFAEKLFPMLERHFPNVTVEPVS
ncbi:MAG: GntR family transcriptional regulator, partial [Lentisphaeria bacterium]|nr:GntR family transcriptional regulator [Lentisphaeria bacterium]